MTFARSLGLAPPDLPSPEIFPRKPARPRSGWTIRDSGSAPDLSTRLLDSTGRGSSKVSIRQEFANRMDEQPPRLNNSGDRVSNPPGTPPHHHGTTGLMKQTFAAVVLLAA